MKSKDFGHRHKYFAIRHIFAITSFISIIKKNLVNRCSGALVKESKYINYVLKI